MPKPMAAALAEFGVRDDTLTDGERAMLDTQGYLPLIGLLDAETLATLRARFDELALIEGETAGAEFHHEPGTTRLADLVNKGEAFDVTHRHPRVLAGIHHVLGEFHLSSLNARAALPGHGLQGMHTDWHVPADDGDYAVCNSIWLLDDFTPDNGATRVVPGSHRMDHLPDGSPHPHETLLIAPAGTVVIFNSHLWHGGTKNRTDLPRRAVHAYYGKRQYSQQTNQREHLRPETAARLTDADRFILDV